MRASKERRKNAVLQGKLESIRTEVQALQSNRAAKKSIAPNLARLEGLTRGQ